ncbi:hypothetical protein TRAPUB_3556 [Trametes pubescens]|uniref:Uncharacterized protein n=1 Tax=Trametes pubescens TaxID=154538 RepID=A0A1M2VDL8_TRAPU|nr:hypothetical protein TRAPUB_3556 [Trametes pubescens]
MRVVDDLRKNWARYVLYTALAALVVCGIGFTAAGVAAGSLAACAQSYFYGGQTGGLFSLLQSLGTRLVMPPLGVLVLAGIAAVVTVPAMCKAISWVWSWWKSRT